MTDRFKVGRNDLCLCGTGKKYKNCCEGKVDWEFIVRNRFDFVPYLSIRGRNIAFANALFDALQLNSASMTDLQRYKAAFTDTAVRKIHEAILKIWPPDTKIADLLRATSSEVSGLYIGDYEPPYLAQDIGVGVIFPQGV